jgi:membrane protein YqaA with SNARE-associated domain
MQTILDALYQWAIGVDGFGLFLIALLDSSFLSFPQVADALVLVQSARHPDWMLSYAAAATLGSLCGCLVLYGVGRAGGDAFLRRRFKAPHVERALRLYQRYGMLAIVVPALLPPPAPFKVFVLLSGAAGVGPLAFGLAVLTGRGARYFAQAWLAATYGDRAAAVVAGHGPQVGSAIAVAAAAFGVWVWRRQQRERTTEPLDAEDAGGVEIGETA